MRVLVGFDVRTLRDREGVALMPVDTVAPVPVSAKSLTPRSSRLGDDLEACAMLDFGESRTLVLEAERVKREKRLDGLWIDSWREEASTLCCRRAEEGEGVRGVRPPAKRVEKMPSRRLMGVITERVAISVIVVVSVCPWWWFVEMFLIVVGRLIGLL